ncbi:MAG: hypothetical protein ABIG43_00390, partial [Chloroflexota bacterium]
IECNCEKQGKTIGRLRIKSKSVGSWLFRMPEGMIDDDTTFAENQDLGLLRHKPYFKMASYRFKLLPVSIAYNFYSV